MFLILIMHALFGAATPISKMLLSYTMPIFFIAIRMIIAGTLLLLISYKMGHLKKLIACNTIATWLMYAQIAIFGFYITYLLRFWGLKQISASKAAFFFNAAPFITGLYSYLLNKEYLNRMKWLGLIIGFIGILPLLIFSSQEKSIVKLFAFSWAEFSILMSVAFHCYGWIIMRKLNKQEGHHPILINGICLVLSGIIALCTSMFTETVPPISNLGHFVTWLMVVILLNNVISHNIYAYLLQCYSPTFLSFTGFLGPLFTALYGGFLLKEPITWHLGISTLFTCLGLYLFYREELQANTIKVFE